MSRLNERIEAQLNPLLSELSISGENEQKWLLPPQSEADAGRLTVVLDMDETLIHSEFYSPYNDYRQEEKRQTAQRDCDFKFSLYTDDGEDIVHVYKRNGLEHFLEQVSLHFEPILFTAALPIYAAPLLNIIDKKKRLRHRLYRDSTVTYCGENFVKDVGLFGRPMGRILIIDNNPQAMFPKPDNAFPIISFYDQDDDELALSLKILMEMKDLKDVRPYLKKKFNFRKQMQELFIGQ